MIYMLAYCHGLLGHLIRTKPSLFLLVTHVISFPLCQVKMPAVPYKHMLTTHLVTTLIFTPKTPDCFREGILFKLNSLLANFIESFTSI